MQLEIYHNKPSENRDAVDQEAGGVPISEYEPQQLLAYPDAMPNEISLIPDQDKGASIEIITLDKPSVPVQDFIQPGLVEPSTNEKYELHVLNTGFRGNVANLDIVQFQQKMAELEETASTALSIQHPYNFKDCVGYTIQTPYTNSPVYDLSAIVRGSSALRPSDPIRAVGARVHDIRNYWQGVAKAIQRPEQFGKNTPTIDDTFIVPLLNNVATNSLNPLVRINPSGKYISTSNYSGDRDFLKQLRETGKDQNVDPSVLPFMQIMSERTLKNLREAAEEYAEQKINIYDQAVKEVLSDSFGDIPEIKFLDSSSDMYVGVTAFKRILEQKFREEKVSMGRIDEIVNYLDPLISQANFTLYTRYPKSILDYVDSLNNACAEIRDRVH